MQVILLHGAGGSAWSMYKIMRFIQNKKYTCYNVTYDCTGDMEQCIKSVNAELHNVVTNETELIIIGQSLGGVIGSQLHKHGWNVKQLIAIASPLKGARFIGEIEHRIQSLFGQTFQNMCNKILMRDIYHDLRDRSITIIDVEEPPHEYHTISTSWSDGDFDGCVYRDETIINAEKHTHIPWSDHRLIFFSERLLIVLEDIILK